VLLKGNNFAEATYKEAKKMQEEMAELLVL
jgi:hypothetical protein